MRKIIQYGFLAWVQYTCHQWRKLIFMMPLLPQLKKMCHHMYKLYDCHTVAPFNTYFSMINRSSTCCKKQTQNAGSWINRGHLDFSHLIFLEHVHHHTWGIQTPQPCQARPLRAIAQRCASQIPRASRPTARVGASPLGYQAPCNSHICSHSAPEQTCEHVMSVNTALERYTEDAYLGHHHTF